MGNTVAEKILCRSSQNDSVSPGEHVICDVDVIMSHDLGTLAIIGVLEDMGVEEIHDPSMAVCPMDHIAPSHTVEDANNKNIIREFVEEQGIENFYDIGMGIAHEVLPEKGHVRPGELIVGSDSHTTSLGAFGAAATGMGTTDLAYAYATGKQWFKVPETIRFEIEGELPAGVSSKDLMLHIAGEFGTNVARYKAIEFAGSTLRGMELDDRFTLSNMSVELGAKFGFTPVDSTVTEYVDEKTETEYEVKRPDDDAEYVATHRIDATDIEPKVSAPHKVGNVADVADTQGIDLDQVFIGSCTHGKLKDLQIAAEVLKDRSVSKDTRLIVTPASREIYDQALEEGYIETINDAGGVVTNATCGACLGLGMGVLGDGDVCLAAQNRNFQGRMGSDAAEIFLSSPETAAASAITGKISDPREVRS